MKKPGPFRLVLLGMLLSGVLVWGLRAPKQEVPPAGEVGPTRIGGSARPAERPIGALPEVPGAGKAARFQTGIDPRFEAYSSAQVLDVLAASDAAGDRDAVLVALATLERRAQLGDDRIPRLLLDGLARFPADRQKALVGVLGRIATPAALEALFELARPGTALRREALAEIAKAGTRTFDNGEFPVELSPLLEQRLPEAARDPALLGAVAGGLSSLGTASGIETLLEFMASRPTAPESEIVARELRAVRNPEAVAPLAARLGADPMSPSAIGLAAGEALAAMGEPAATEALLNWAAQAEGERARGLALRWFGEVRDDASFDLVMAGQERYRFRDPALLAAIQAEVRAQDAEARPYVEGPAGR
jgi:hypothetical protein